LSKIEIDKEDKAEYLEELEKEEKEKLQRCAEFVSSIEANNKHGEISYDPIDDYTCFDRDPNFDGIEHSSDEEVFEEFFADLSDIFELIKKNANSNNIEIKNRNNEYDEPR
jgi:hypothetical protein